MSCFSYFILNKYNGSRLNVHWPFLLNLSECLLRIRENTLILKCQFLFNEVTKTPIKGKRLTLSGRECLLFKVSDSLPTSLKPCIVTLKNCAIMLLFFSFHDGEMWRKAGRCCLLHNYQAAKIRRPRFGYHGLTFRYLLLILSKKM